MSFDQYGDAGTAKAIQDALAEIAGEGQRVVDMIDKAPPCRSGLETLPYIPLGQIFQPTAFRSDIKDLVKSMFPLFWGVYRGSNVLIRAGWEIRQSLRGVIGRSIAPMRPALIDGTPASAVEYRRPVGDRSA